MNEELSRMYPTLMRLLAGSGVAADLEKAKACFGTADPVECVHEKRSKGDFASGLMTYHLCAALGKNEWFDPLVPHVEADLGKISGCVGRFDDLVSAFRRKLLNDKEFDDVVYEIAAAAVFADILDGGRLSLEEPLDKSTKKNPDVTGAWGGRRTRAEVTVVHDDWPPRYSQEAQEVVESAGVPGGYTATLNVPLTEKTDAEGVDDALFGSGVALVPLLETSGSMTRETPAAYARTGLGPFTDLSRLRPEQAAALRGEVDRFKRVSAVLVLRLDGSYPLGRVVRNPNADQPLGPQDCERLGQVALARAVRKSRRPQAGSDQGRG